MTPSKLGFLPSSMLATVLATAVGVAPINGALAAPPEDEGEEISVGDPEGEEGEEISVGDPEGEEGEEISVGGPEGEEGEEIAVGDPEGEEGEEIAVGDPEGEGEGELPEAEETEGEGETEAEAEAEEIAAPPPSIDEMRPPEPTWGGPKNQYPRNGKGMLITGGIVTGLGAAFIVTSVLITRCDFDSSLSCKYGDQRDFLIPTAVATTGLGLLLIGVGVGNHIKYKRWQNWTPEQTAVVPTHVPGGGGLAWVGRF